MTSTGKLFITLWRIGLENLPEGTFTRRRIAPHDAKLLIGGARRTKRLMCVSDDDILAPHHQHTRDNHEALCKVLSKDFGIPLLPQDFASPFEHEGETLFSVNPLSLVKVQGRNQLLVITCHFTWEPGVKSKRPLFSIASDTVSFHLFESATSMRVPVRRKHSDSSARRTVKRKTAR